MSKIIVLGIDQGLASCGYGLLEFNIVKNKAKLTKVLTYGVIKTTTRNNYGERLDIIYNKLEDLINKYNPSIIACERLFYSTPKKGNRNKSASIITTNMVTGIIHLLAGRKSINLKDFVPSSVKKAITGNGTAKKEDMIETIPKLLKIDEALIKIEHIADALAIAYTAIMHNEDEK